MSWACNLVRLKNLMTEVLPDRMLIDWLARPGVVRMTRRSRGCEAGAE